MQAESPCHNAPGSSTTCEEGSSKLVFIASNRKGDALFRELKNQYSTATYIPAGYASLPLPFRLLIRSRAVRPHLKGNVRIDGLLREILFHEVRRRLERGIAGTPSDLIFWFPLFALKNELRQHGRLLPITDVAMDDAYFDNFGVPPGKARRFRQNLWEVNSRNCEEVLTLSQWAADSNKRLFPEYSFKIREVGWGPNVASESVDQVFGSVRPNRILCVGHDYYRKGADLYNEVARRLKRKIPDLECLMVGRPGKGLQPASLDSLSCRDSVSPAELATLYQTSKLFLLLSRFEPSAHVVVEAMSFGLPVICTNRGGSFEPLLEGETGFACHPENIDGVVERALCLLENSAVHRHFSLGAYQQATSQWQWRHVAERIMRVAKKVPVR
jgi:glycosyltransferase involved in cell wall biosynthesis